MPNSNSFSDSEWASIRTTRAADRLRRMKFGQPERTPLFGRSAPKKFNATDFKDSLPCDSCGKREPCGCDQGM